MLEILTLIILRLLLHELLFELVILLNHHFALIYQLLLLVHELTERILELLLHVVDRFVTRLVEIELLFLFQVLLNCSDFIFQLYLRVILGLVILLLDGSRLFLVVARIS